MKDYINFEGLSNFLDNLFKKFSIIGHTHSKDEISDLQDMTAIATDDDNGNVVLVCTSASTTYNDRLNVLEEEVETINTDVSTLNTNMSTLNTEVETLNTVINDNDILVVNNASK